MPKPAVLIYENDAGHVEDLNQVLTSAGYEVYAADRPEAVVSALQATPFPVVVLDATVAAFDPVQFCARLAESRPDTAIVMTGTEISAAKLLALMRNGACDYLAKPFAPDEVVERVKANVTRRHRSRSELRQWQERAITAERNSGDASAAVPAAVAERVQQFTRAALASYMQLERENLDHVRRTMAEDDPRVAEIMSAPVHTWLVHHDPEFVRGLMGMAPRLELDFKPPLTTGGEVLDRLGRVEPQLLIIGDQLPDIPLPLVIETVTSRHPDVAIIEIDGWGTDRRVARLLSGQHGDLVEREMGTVNDLIEVIGIARQQARHTAFHRDFADRFRERHADFLAEYGDIMRMLGADQG